VGNGKRGQAGEPAATDDGEHGLEVWLATRGKCAGNTPLPPKNPAQQAAQLLLCSTLVILVNS
jgi:hypothetical protein